MKHAIEFVKHALYGIFHMKTKQSELEKAINEINTLIADHYEKYPKRETDKKRGEEPSRESPTGGLPHYGKHPHSKTT